MGKNQKYTVCGAIFEDEDGRTCSCDIRVPEPTDIQVQLNHGSVYPFRALHAGHHSGSPINMD